MTITDAELTGEIAAIQRSGDKSDARLNRVMSLINNVLPYEKRQRMHARFAYELGLKVGNTGEEVERNDADKTITTRLDDSLCERVVH